MTLTPEQLQLVQMLQMAQASQNPGPPPPPPEYVKPQLPPPPGPWMSALENAGAAVSSMPWYPARDFGSGLGQGFVRGLAGSFAGRGQARAMQSEAAAKAAGEQNERIEGDYRERVRTWHDLQREAGKAWRAKKEKEAEAAAKGDGLMAFEELPAMARQRLGKVYAGKRMRREDWSALFSMAKPEEPEKPKTPKRPRLTPEASANAAGDPLAERARYWEGLKSETAVKPGAYFPEKTARAGMAADSALVYRNWQVAAEDYGRRIGLAATEDDLDEIAEDMRRGAANLPPWVLDRLKAQIADTGKAIRAGGGE